jgi:hypothetical protein
MREKFTYFREIFLWRIFFEEIILLHYKLSTKVFFTQVNDIFHRYYSAFNRRKIFNKNVDEIFLWRIVFEECAC